MTSKQHIGTLDELEPELRALGFTAARTMAGDIPLDQFDPYGMRRIGSVNIQSEQWAHHVYRGQLIEINGKHYLQDVPQEPVMPPFCLGLFELI